MLKPIDSLDAVAQMHDSGYQIAEELGAGRPGIADYYKSMADFVAEDEANSLDRDPAKWSNPPTNASRASDLRDRILAGSRYVVGEWNLFNATQRSLAPNIGPDGVPSIEEFEAKQREKLRAWTVVFNDVQAKKTGGLKQTSKSATLSPLLAVANLGAPLAAPLKAWRLVETRDFATKPVDSRYSLNYSRGAITLGWKSDTESFTVVDTWTEPPSVIAFGDTVTITMGITILKNVGRSAFVTGSLQIWFDSPDIVPGYSGSQRTLTGANGESKLEVSHRGNAANDRLSRTVSIPATKLPGGSDASQNALRDGYRIALLVTANIGHIAGTQYIYEWGPVSASSSQRAGNPPDERTLFKNWNTGAVASSPSAPTVFELRDQQRVTYINTYHYHGGRGAPAGTIALRHSDGTLYGPWNAQGIVSSGAPDGCWEVRPNVLLKPGVYTVIVSNPMTWSHNAASGGRGFAEVRGYPER